MSPFKVIMSTLSWSCPQRSNSTSSSFFLCICNGELQVQRQDGRKAHRQTPSKHMHQKPNLGGRQVLNHGLAFPDLYTVAILESAPFLPTCIKPSIININDKAGSCRWGRRKLLTGSARLISRGWWSTGRTRCRLKCIVE